MIPLEHRRTVVQTRLLSLSKALGLRNRISTIASHSKLVTQGIQRGIEPVNLEIRRNEWMTEASLISVMPHAWASLL